jgi:hypothetical protein
MELVAQTDGFRFLLVESASLLCEMVSEASRLYTSACYSAISVPASASTDSTPESQQNRIHAGIFLVSFV